MENGDPESQSLMDDKKEADRWDKFPYFNGIDRKEFTDKKKG